MKKIFMRGLITLTPLALTVAVLYWLVATLEGIFRDIIVHLLGPEFYFPGLGILCGLVLVFLFGLLINYLIIQKIYHWAETKLKKIPLIKTLYSSFGDMMDFFRKKEGRGSEVVEIDIGFAKMIGIVTKTDWENSGLDYDDEVVVYIPFSYQVGGHMVILPRSKVKTLPISVEQAMRMVMTGGVAVQARK